MMRFVLVAVGSLLIVLGGLASSQGADGTLRILPAMLPPFLTPTGIVAVYIVPGLVLFVAGAWLWYRREP